jgi:hypothetical protein
MTSLSRGRGRDLAKHLGCKLIETPAKVRHNVEEVTRTFGLIGFEVKYLPSTVLRLSRILVWA